MKHPKVVWKSAYAWRFYAWKIEEFEALEAKIKESSKEDSGIDEVQSGELPP